ncbi:MAG: filamentous hemagglutinin N-terminal domain-containing protein, partial [Limnothrix sp.]
NWNLSGGSFSGDGRNLFHNFQNFSLDTNQSATFFSSSEIHNILSRVSSGNPSLIDGLLQISGSNANLYFLNPAGIVFGENTQLNLPADFTASTASELGFGQKIWQNSTNYSELVGTPNRFFFEGTGGLINGANLAVKQGQSLNLFASEIINTGSLTAKQGAINLTAVPGTNTLTLSQAGQILNLEFTTNQTQITTVDIPRLLTGHSLNTGLSLQNGQVNLAGQNQTTLGTNSGSVFVSGTVDVSGTTAGTTTILGNEVVLLGAELDDSGKHGGGQVLVGGDFQGKGLFTNARNTFVDANSTISVAAIASGAKSALGSLWYVSDEGTLGLMTSFYKELKAAPIKAGALQRAQLDMLRGNVRREGNQLVTPTNTIPLPDVLLQQGTPDLTHPYYWSGFSLVGNPW